MFVPAGRAADLKDLVGTTVYNRSIYRLERTDGTTFGIPNLAPLQVERVSGDEVWLSVDGEEGRISSGDRERIAERRAQGLLPEDWSWVWETDPRTTHPDWDESFWEAIQNRVVAHEMTEAMVRMAYGEPDKININPRPENVQEHWVYSTGSIWFVEGKVFSWQAP